MGHGVTTHHAYSRKKEHVSLFQCLRGDYQCPKSISPFFVIGMETPTFVLGMWPTRRKTAFPASFQQGEVTELFSQQWDESRRDVDNFSLCL